MLHHHTTLHSVVISETAEYEWAAVAIYTPPATCPGLTWVFFQKHADSGNLGTNQYYYTTHRPTTGARNMYKPCSLKHHHWHFSRCEAWCTSHKMHSKTRLCRYYREVQDLCHIIEWTDGCAAQFKCRTSVFDTSQHAQGGMPVHRSYFNPPMANCPVMDQDVLWKTRAHTNTNKLWHVCDSLC